MAGKTAPNIQISLLPLLKPQVEKGSMIENSLKQIAQAIGFIISMMSDDKKK